MPLTLRQRIVLTLVPPILLLTVLGGAGVVLLTQLGDSARRILRENYDSVLAMERLNEALERIDSSFQISLTGTHDETLQQQAHGMYVANWDLCRKNVDFEKKNVTVAGEAELVARLNALIDQYHTRGDAFYALPDDDPARKHTYYAMAPDGGLLSLFREIKTVKEEILVLNQNNMEQAARDAEHTAEESLLWFGAGLAVAIVLAGVSAWHTIRTILRPMQSVTQAALGISAGNLDQVVPYAGKDELGQLAQAFNTMAHRLRDYRQSQSAQLLRAQQTMQAAIDSFPDAVLVVDFDGYVEMANPSARRLLGVVPRDPQAATSGLWQPPESLRQPLAEALSGQRDYLPEGFDRTILFASGTHERVVLPRILTIRDPTGQALGAAVLLQDVTRLRLLDQMKSNLVASASHELKTPLTSIRLALHLLLEEAVGPLAPKQTELLLDARENSERLLATVNNLLDLARLEHGSRQLNVRSESLQSLLHAAGDALRPRADDKGVALVLDIPTGLPPALVDEARLAHALGNLLDNALTYTERGGTITLAAAADGDSVIVSVADTGIGIPPEHIPHVFEKFFRVPGQSRGSGTGLGLAIVHEIVTAHGGSISCESTPGAGSIFRLRLPRGEEAGG